MYLVVIKLKKTYFAQSATGEMQHGGDPAELQGLEGVGMTTVTGLSAAASRSVKLAAAKSVSEKMSRFNSTMPQERKPFTAFAILA